MRVETFSESYVNKDGFIRGMDSRAKILFVAACLLLAVVSSNPVVPVTVGAVCLVLVAVSGAPLWAVALRMSEPLIFAAILAAMQVFLTRGETIASLGLFGMSFSISAVGLHKGILIMSRVFGAVSSVLFLTMTTPVHRLLSAAARLRAPKALVEISLFAYRYIFVLIEDAITIYHAQKGRLGYAGFGRGIRSLATLAGSVFLRAFNQAEATGESMAMRGYTGEYIPSFNEKLRPRDALLLGTLFSVCLAVNLWM